MKPHLHAVASAKKYGGTYEEYLHLHEWFDHTKSHVADGRHRVLLHNSWGIFLLSQVFGSTFKNSEGRLVSVRDVGEDHVLQDLGHIPSLADVLQEYPLSSLDKLFKRKEKVKYSLEQFLNLD